MKFTLAVSALALATAVSALPEGCATTYTGNDRNILKYR